MEIKTDALSIKVNTKNATNAWDKFLDCYKLWYEYIWKIRRLKYTNKVLGLMGRFKNYGKKLKRQTHLGKNGFKLAVDFLLFYSLFNCILVSSYFPLFLFSFCKLSVKNWQIILIYPSIFLILHLPYGHFVCNLGVLSLVWGPSEVLRMLPFLPCFTVTVGLLVNVIDAQISLQDLCLVQPSDWQIPRQIPQQHILMSS